MNNAFITLVGKTLAAGSKLSNRGSGSTWPGHIALGLKKTYIHDLLSNAPTEFILIVGTNGKTTTGRILTTVLEKSKKKAFQNNTGANLLNGIASSLLLHTNFRGRLTADFGIFEVDENNLPLVLQELTPKAIIVLDLFRDQLDRYGELDSIAKKWQAAFAYLPHTTHLILNADDPLVAYLGQSQSIKAQVSYFGLDQTTESGHELQHAADSLYCPRCNNKLHFQKIFYSHLGIWKCPHCKLQRPLPHMSSTYFPLDGTYNKYNTLAAALTAQVLGLDRTIINDFLHAVTPAFGRQEKLVVKGKTIQIFLAKNPTGFNETLRTIHEKGAKYVAFILNDRIPDGTDISWIWDIDIEKYINVFSSVTIGGDRAFDMGLRLEYASEIQNAKIKMQNNLKFQILNSKFSIEPNLKIALQEALEQTPSDEILYILPTYSAMLEVRKILTGRKIL